MSSMAVDERWLATSRPRRLAITRDGTYPTFAWLLAGQLADGRYIAFPRSRAKVQSRRCGPRSLSPEGAVAPIAEGGQMTLGSTE